MDARETRRLPEQLRRERLLDIEERLVPYRRAAFALLAGALLLSGPWVGWWWLAPLAVALAAFGAADRLMKRSAHPERWSAAAWGIAPLMVAVSVALTGGPDSPALAWFALPATTLAARFESKGMIAGLAFTVALMVVSTVGVDPGLVADEPQLLVFPVALTGAVVILTSAVVRSDKEHRREAVVDSLTGLLNRAALGHRLAELEQQARKDPEAPGVGFLLGDLDHFKRINDGHGHAMGDSVLKEVAYAMRKSLRAFDLIYRVGGEEFAVLLPGGDAADCAQIAERLRADVESCSRPGIPVSISFGAAVSDSRDLDLERLFQDADAALYEAKRAGRNQVRAAA